MAFSAPYAPGHRPRGYVAARLTGGRALVLPAEIIREDRVVGSRGQHPLDRVEIEVAGQSIWVERRDLCDEHGEPEHWVDYEERTDART